MAARVLCGLAVACAPSCASWVPPDVEPYYAGDLGESERIFRARLEASDAGDWALMANELASTLDAQGREDEAWRLFLDAGRAMEAWDASLGERVGTVVGREDTREYKGEPYERVFNSVYTGILSWRRGEPDNARASFKEAMLRDAEQSDEQFASDFAPSFLLAAWASRAMGRPDEARGFLDEARKARGDAAKNGARGPATPRAFRDFDDSDLLVLASVGRGPVKVRRGKQGEIVDIESPPQHAARARVYVNGTLRGETEILGDVYYQARTRGGRWLDGIREGKAIFKDVTETAGTILLFEGASRREKGLLLAGAISLFASMLTSVDPDLRCWRTLPDTLQGIALQVGAGRHRVHVEFIGYDGRVMRGYSREVEIDMPPTQRRYRGTQLLHFRSIPRPIPLKTVTTQASGGLQ